MGDCVQRTRDEGRGVAVYLNLSHRRSLPRTGGRAGAPTQRAGTEHNAAALESLWTHNVARVGAY